MDGCGDIIGHGFKDDLIILREGIPSVRLNVQNAHHLFMIDERDTKLGVDILRR